MIKFNKNKIFLMAVFLFLAIIFLNPINVFAADSPVVNFTNPLGEITTLEGLVSNLLSAVQKIIVSLALVFIVVGAIMVLVSAGSPETVEKGKKAITMAIVGLTIGIAAPSILKEIANAVGWGCPEGATDCGTLTDALNFSDIALNVLSFLLGIAGILAMIMLVIGGIMYLTSAGDEDRVEQGKKTFKYAVIGIVVIMSSMIIVRQIANLFL